MVPQTGIIPLTKLCNFDACTVNVGSQQRGGRGKCGVSYVSQKAKKLGQNSNV
jgi:hypothetical protein